MKKDLDYIAKVEQAIADKYGEVAIKNPKSNWNKKKEEEYLAQIKKNRIRDDKLREKTQKVFYNGFLVSKKYTQKSSERVCPVCSVYSFKLRDDAYMNKYNCCYKCYEKHVEHREEYWDASTGTSCWHSPPFRLRLQRRWHNFKNDAVRVKNILVKTSIRQLIISKVRKLIKWLNPTH